MVTTMNSKVFKYAGACTMYSDTWVHRRVSVASSSFVAEIVRTPDGYNSTTSLVDQTLPRESLV